MDRRVLGFFWYSLSPLEKISGHFGPFKSLPYSQLASAFLFRSGCAAACDVIRYLVE
jgi:hypothetical protein